MTTSILTDLTTDELCESLYRMFSTAVGGVTTSISNFEMTSLTAKVFNTFTDNSRLQAQRTTTRATTLRMQDTAVYEAGMGPMSPKKRSTSVSSVDVQGLDLNGSMSSLKEKEETESTARDMSGENSFGTLKDTEVVVVDFDDDETEQDYSEDPTQTEVDCSETDLNLTTVPVKKLEMIKEIKASQSKVDVENVQKSGNVRRGVQRTFSDEDFPAPKAEKRAPARRQVARQISFESDEGRVVLCKADRRARRNPSRGSQGSVDSTFTADTSEATMSPTRDCTEARIVPKALPSSAIEDGVGEKKIAWEKPEWTKSPILRSPKEDVAATVTKQAIGWEKPAWAKSTAD